LKKENSIALAGGKTVHEYFVKSVVKMGKKERRRKKERTIFDGAVK